MCKPCAVGLECKAGPGYLHIVGLWVADEVENFDGEVLAAGGEGDVDWAGVDGACKSEGAGIGTAVDVAVATFEDIETSPA